MGHTVTGSDLKASPVTERLARPGDRGGRRPPARRTWARPTRSPTRPAVRPEQPRAGARPSAGVLVLARSGRGPGGHRRHPPLPGRGRDPRQDHDGVHAVADPGRGGPAAVVPHRRRRQRDRDQRGVGRRGSGWWWRPTRATAPSGPSVPRWPCVTNVEPDHLDHYGTFEALRAAFGDVPRPRPPGGGGGGRRPGGRADLGRRHGAPQRRHATPGPPTAMIGRRAARGSSVSFTSAGPERPTRAASSSPCPGCTTPATPPWPPRRPRGRGARSTPPSAPWPASPGCPGASSSGARPTASPSSTTTPTCPPRCAPPWPPPGPAAGDGWWPCSSPTATRRTAALAERVRRRLRRRRRRGGHRRLRRRRPAGARGVRAAWWSTPWPRAGPAHGRSVYAPGRTAA